MEWLHALIGPDYRDQTWQQLCLRAVLLFFFGIVCIRIAGRRTFSHATPLDIIVGLIVGSNISRIMTGGASFVPGLAATLVLVCLHRIVAMATQHHNLLAGLVKGRPTVVVRDGDVDAAALTRHGLSHEDLLEALRLEQVERPEDAHLVTVERGGRISVVRRK